MPLTDAYVWYRFDGDVTDSGGNGRTMVSLADAPEYLPGLPGFGQGMSPPPNEQLNLKSPPIPSPCQAITIAGWVKDQDRDNGHIATIYDGANEVAYILGSEDDNGPIRFYYQNSATGIRTVLDEVTVVTGWYHFAFAVSYDGEEGLFVKLYINGVLQLDLADDNPNGLTGFLEALFVYPLCLGIDPIFGEQSSTLWTYDLWGVWLRELTDGEVAQLYNSGAGYDPFASVVVLPPAGDVRAGVVYDTNNPPNPGDVRAGVVYG